MQKINLNKDLNEVLEMFPKLKLSEKDKKKSVCGEIAIFDAADNYVDSFDIKVTIPRNYPHGFPLLFETGNKFEHIPDRHISEDGSCCVSSLQESDLVSQKGITIKDFFLRYVIPYLANQLYFDSQEEWANGDYEHGSDGILQYYRELFKMDDIEQVISLLYFFNTKKMNRNDNCFCGSGSKLKRCHLDVYCNIKDFSKTRIEMDLLYLKQLSKKRARKQQNQEL
ncbi:SEC-C metal-binding domain-containing protein [Flavobacterium acetivorans]|uniref:SEC-C metal-binding domain-containing protein n=1 Tax=Flavobacterium acetivorans TaxID=2893883 RepID=UPI001E4F1C09|nr:SEC-C metal-binding domain-containing protein [Flavobacterium sp. F-29]UFH34550.1 SEC-C domain-containing protein [Flavobacterium sp. F-29]